MLYAGRRVVGLELETRYEKHVNVRKTGDPPDAIFVPINSSLRPRRGGYREEKNAYAKNLLRFTHSVFSGKSRAAVEPLPRSNTQNLPE